MNVRIKYKEYEDARHASHMMPCECHLLTDRTSDTYLEFNEKYYDYWYQYVRGHYVTK